MKAILEIPDKEFKKEFENLTMSMHWIVGSRSSVRGMYMEYYPVGQPFTIMTSNIPEPLKKAIDDMVEYYCENNGYVV